MISIKAVIFRNLTDADFFNINKPPGMEIAGGGQSYIDFPISSVTKDDWEYFFEGCNDITSDVGMHARPIWKVPIRSLGFSLADQQTVKIFQRRPASFSIASQKLNTSKSNRIHSWHPSNGFPAPIDTTNRHQCPNGLIIYLVSTNDGNIWAGWFLNDGTSTSPFRDKKAENYLSLMLNNIDARNGESGFIALEENLVFMENASQPFFSGDDSAIIEEISSSVVENEEQNEADALFEDDIQGPPEIIQRTINIRSRNKRVVSKLKELYGHTCQITGNQFIFKKKNGEGYTEAHHLVPLGKNGDDTAKNLVVLCPQMHRMLHHADVSEINLSNIVTDRMGYGKLKIYINGQEYTITWHPSHARLVTGE